MRNEVLKRLKDNPKEAADLYATHWRPFEESFANDTQRDNYFSPFALTRDHTLTKPRTFSRLAAHWTSLCDGETDKTAQTKLILADLSEHVPAYNAIAAGRPIPGLPLDVAEQIERLHRLPCPTVVYPYILQLITTVASGGTDSRDATTCRLLIESFLVRRAFVGDEPTGLHAVFKKLWGEAKADPNKVRANIATNTIKFPDDAQFREAIAVEPLYLRKIKAFVLEEYERSYTAGDILDTFPPLTVDHVLPQNPEGDWLHKFKEKDRARLTDTWANLVPLSSKANTERGRSSWEDTREKLSNETVFATTKYIYNSYEDWNVAAVESRAEVLQDWALARWPSTVARAEARDAID